MSWRAIGAKWQVPDHVKVYELREPLVAANPDVVGPAASRHVQDVTNLDIIVGS